MRWGRGWGRGSGSKVAGRDGALYAGLKASSCLAAPLPCLARPRPLLPCLPDPPPSWSLEQEEEERELEEVEDLLEYYLQRAANTQVRWGGSSQGQAWEPRQHTRSTRHRSSGLWRAYLICRHAGAHPAPRAPPGSQRLQSEAERLLAGARDLEESIGVSLSARRFEVGGAARAREGGDGRGRPAPRAVPPLPPPHGHVGVAPPRRALAPSHPP